MTRLVAIAMVGVLGCGNGEETPAATPCGDLCASMVLVEGGRFMMGSPDGEGTERSRPQHAVDVARAYYLDPYLVTNDQYRQFLEINGMECFHEGQAYPCYDCSPEAVPDAGIDCDTLELKNNCVGAPGEAPTSSCAAHPVTLVTWYGADAYCRAVGKRLATEAEWERAANGPGGVDGAVWRRFSWGNDCPTEFNGTEEECSDFRADEVCDGETWTFSTAKANCLEEYCNDGFDGTSPVGWFEAGKTSEGLYDMTGNVMEWVADCWHPSFEPSEGVPPPTDGSAWMSPCSEPRRTATGGGWLDCGSNLRMAFRGGDLLGASDPDVGFRCAHDGP